MRLPAGAGRVLVVPEREVLQGGVANAGAVVREGAYVLRPSNPHSELIQALFRHVRAAGFDGVPEPVGIDPDGRERLVFIPGETAWPPFPTWCQTDTALGSIAELLARFHAAAQGFEAPAGATWNQELADPASGHVICHNDVCVESLDPTRRLRLVADSYGLPPGREELVRIIEQQMAAGGAFVRSRVERGEPAFVEMWERMGGEARYDRRRDWFAHHRDRFIDTLG
jgi:hypothetical protein